MDPAAQSILFFDGDCGLCSRAVRFLAGRDRRARLHFAPLQGSTAAELLPLELRRSLRTAVYRRAGHPQPYLKSEAVLRALIDTGSRWRHPARAALWLPAGLRDALYDAVARNRRRCFKKKACPLPSEATGQRILP